MHISPSNQHTRFFSIAGITIKINFPEAIRPDTFKPKFNTFELDQAPSDHHIEISHSFEFPGPVKTIGEQIYHRAPWSIYKNQHGFIYEWIRPEPLYSCAHHRVVANADHSGIEIFHDRAILDNYRKGANESLSLLPTDQILISPFLATVSGGFFHSSAMIFEQNGFIFMGHSGAGKSTLSLMLKDRAQILCDDRNIIRKEKEKFKVYGTWSHGDVEEVSSAGVPLKGIFFLEQAVENTALPLNDKKAIVTKLLAFMVRPLVTTAWWNQMFDLVEDVASAVPCYTLKFDKTGKAADLLCRMA